MQLTIQLPHDEKVAFPTSVIMLAEISTQRGIEVYNNYLRIIDTPKGVSPTSKFNIASGSFFGLIGALANPSEKGREASV
jgi:hypothetical protein